MAARKRKLPERKPVRKDPGILARAFAALSNTVAAYPLAACSTAAFAIVFSFVTANALWYQPGGHPSPLIRTRDMKDPVLLVGFSSNQPAIPHDDVTTFRIEREAPAAPEAANATQTPATQPQTSAVATPPVATPSTLVEEIQKELATRGYYSGKADGLMGPRTASAIRAYEESAGLAVTGEPGGKLLGALRIDSATVSAIPAERPSGETANVPRKPAPPQVARQPADPVADLIRQPNPAPVPPAAIPAANSVASVPAVSADVVMQIQRGLVNISYTDVAVDGVAGERTRLAIRQFEKHYRLPETGMPSEAVLKKLRSIGAL